MISFKEALRFFWHFSHRQVEAFTPVCGCFGWWSKQRRRLAGARPAFAGVRSSRSGLLGPWATMSTYRLHYGPRAVRKPRSGAWRSSVGNWARDITKSTQPRFQKSLSKHMPFLLCPDHIFHLEILEMEQQIVVLSHWVLSYFPMLQQRSRNA